MKVFSLFKLCKPRISLALLTVFFLSYLIGSKGGNIFTGPFLTGLLGVVFSIGGANTLNNYFDRDIDSIMIRTRHRPLPKKEIRSEVALAFGLLLSLISALISLYLGLLPLILLSTGFLSYVFVYTIMSKRKTSLSIFFVAPAVASPAWFGWWAATGSINMKGFLTGLLIAFWGPLHFWSLALSYSKDYRRAKVPVLPVIVSFKVAVWHVVASSLMLIFFTYIPFISGFYGYLYLMLVSTINFCLLTVTLHLLARPNTRRSWVLYKFSSPYILGVLIAMALDQALLLS